MTKLLVVFGATGQQGSSVINHVLRDAHLSVQYRIRGVTRDPSKPAAEALRVKGVEIIQADADHPESLQRAMHGANITYIMTAPSFDDERAKPQEIAQGKAMADAAVAAGLEYIIFSTLPYVAKISGGKYKTVDYFDAKAEVEEYIRGLPIKSAFYCPGWFMQNFNSFMAPQRMEDGSHAVVNIISPQTEAPFLDVVADTGTFVGSILADPGKFEGKVLSAAQRVYTMDEVVKIMSKVSGKTIRYQQVSADKLGGNLPPAFVERLIGMLNYIQNCGYFGPRTDELVKETVNNTKGKLTTLEEYLAREPLQL